MINEDRLARWIIGRPVPPPAQPDSGIYHYFREEGDTYTKFHLRVEPDSNGTLIVNATVAARLSPSGVVIAKGLLEQKTETDVMEEINLRFRNIPPGRLNQDIVRIQELVANLSSPGDNYPIINLEDADISPFESRLMAPLRADLTSASSESLFPIMDRLWQVGIPHVTFNAGEELIPEQLISAVERAEDIGMIAGFRGRASDLNQNELVRMLAISGIDYISLFFASADPGIHDSLFGDGDYSLIEPFLREFRELEIACVVGVPLLQITTRVLGDTLQQLDQLGVTNVDFFAIAVPDDHPHGVEPNSLRAAALPQLADLVEEWANEADVRFVWQPTVMRDPSLALEQQVRNGPRCSDDLSVRIESNGEVIPARGPYRSAGNILSDEWQNIWNHPSFRRYRERVEQPTRCVECPGMAICAADCPQDIRGWSQMAGVES